MRLTVYVLPLFGAILLGCTNQPGELVPASERAQAYVNLARGYLGEGDFVRAHGPLRRALELDPELVEAHVLAGVLYERQHEADLAERHFNTALELDPGDAQALNNYGAFLYGQGRLEAALGPLRRAVRDTDYRLRAQAFENLGLAQLGLGRLGDAKLSFERALALGRSQPRSSLELAAIHYSQRDYEAAEHHYRAYLTQAEQTPRSLCLGLQLGRVPGANERSANHEQWLRAQYPEAISACR